ncbi:MAG: SDR family NAD(P)-dependent oxidoreductase, partial [Actinomycetia bacterium]|nr:SDR family NAD(P)-dependent oxidoreductase [Actinomycetes bacterium]
MTGRVAGKVALISGAGRGQGRSHARRLAEEGANIVAFDVCHPIDTAPYEMSTTEDLKETARLVESVGGKIVYGEADVRDATRVQAIVDQGVDEFGRLDIHENHTFARPV